MDTLLDVAVSNAAVAGLLGLIAWFVGLVCRRPAVVHALWLLVLLKLVTPPVVAVPISWTPPAVANQAAVELVLPALPAAAPDPAPLAAVDVPAWDMLLLAEEPRWEDAVPLPRAEAVVPIEAAAMVPDPAPVMESPAAAPAAPWASLRTGWLVVWLAGAVGWLALMLGRVRRFQRLLVHARPAPPDVAVQVAALADQLELRRPPITLLVPGAVSPMLWGRPGAARLLIPAALLERLDDEQRATLLVHELAHLRRRDHWVRLVELLATALFWWHPVVWWARHGLREAEEQLCDAWVVWALPAAAKSYAIALVETLNFLADAPTLALPPAASGVGQVPMLKRRLTMIMRGSMPRTLSAAGLFGVLGLGALLLPFVPTLAQADPEAPDPVRKIEIELRDVVKVKEADPAKREQIEKIKEETRKLTEEMEKARARTHELEQRLLEAHRRLAELGAGDGRVILMLRDGKPVGPFTPGVPVPPPPAGGPPRDVLFQRFEMGPLGENERQAIKARIEQRHVEMTKAEADLEQLRKNLESIQKVLKDGEGARQATEVLKDLIARRENELRIRKAEISELKARTEASAFLPQPAIAVTQPFGGGDKRMQDLERKLNELLREVQGLRQEMNRPGERGPRVAPSAPPAPPTPPAAPRPPRRESDDR